MRACSSARGKSCADHVDARAGEQVERLGEDVRAALHARGAEEQAPAAPDHSGFQRRVRYSIFGVFFGRGASAGCGCDSGCGW